MDRTLKIIDFLLPLMRLSLDLIKQAVNTYMMNSIESDSFDLVSLNPEDISSLFDNRHKEFIEPVINLLATDVPYVGKKVNLVDVLTILTCFFQGPVIEKARLIFTWYNASKSGALSETELKVLLTRIRRIFSKLNLLGRLEITQDDINHIAFQARVIKNNTVILPTLTFSDFFLWFSENELTKAFNSFVNVLGRLIDVFHSLENRADSMSLIFHEKQIYKPYAKPVPHWHFLGCKDACQINSKPASTSVIYIGRYSISICLPEVDQSTTSLFIECKKLRKLQYPHYKLAKNLTSSKPTTNCCSREYELTSYQSVGKLLPTHWRQTCHRSVRVNIRDLEPDSTYRFVVYSNKWKYPDIALRTQMTAAEVASLTEDTVKLCVLPASLDAVEVEQYIHDTPSLATVDTAIFTGTVCPIQHVLQQAIQLSTCHMESVYREDGFRLGRNMSSSIKSFSEAVYSLAESAYAHSWSPCQRRLLSCRALNPHLVNEFLPAPSARQLISFVGMGPWSCSRWRSECMSAIKPLSYFLAMESKLERLYGNYVSAILPPYRCFDIGIVKLVMLRTNRSNCRADENISPAALPGLIADLTKNAVTANDTQHIILLARTPADFLEDKDNWSKPREPPMYVPKNDKSRPAGKEVELVGSYEIKHGEYTSVEAAAHALTLRRREEFHGEDAVFAEVCDVLLDWLEGSPSTRRVTWLSAGWENGVNFRIHRDSDTAIEHQCLLETRTTTAALTSDDPLIQRMQSSLSSGTAFSLSMPSPLRTVVIRASPTAAPSSQILEFLPVPNHSPVSLLPSLNDVKAIANSGNKSASAPLHLSQGPFIADISSTSASIDLYAHGSGSVTCTLYNIPISATYADASALLLTDMKSLRVVTTTSKDLESSFETLLTFYFNDLSPYSNYCASFEPTILAPHHICLFKTMCEVDANTCTIVTSELPAEDLSSPSLNLSKLDHFFDSPRPPATCLYIRSCSNKGSEMTTRSSRDESTSFLSKLRDKSGILRVFPAPVISLSDLIFIKRRLAVYNYGSESVPILAPGASTQLEGITTRVSIMRNGKFCRMCSICEGVRGLLDMAAAMDEVDTMNVQSLVIFVTRPLVHYLKNDSLRGWQCDLDIHRVRRANEVFLKRVITWKKGSTYRDCLIMCTCDVDRVHSVSIWRCDDEHKHNEGVQVASQMYEGIGIGSDSSSDLVVRHLLLPRDINLVMPGITVCPHDSKSVFGIGNSIRYRFDNMSAVSTGVKTTSPRLHLYGSNVNDEPMNVMNIIDITIPYIDKGIHAKASATHQVSVHSMATCADLVQVVTGPVIGLVNTQMAKILFEFNRDLSNVKCVLREAGDHADGFKEQVKKRVRAFRAVVFTFKGLKRGQEYKLYLPDLEGNAKDLGVLRTPPVNLLSFKLAFVGNDPFEDLQPLDSLVRQITQQQSPDIRNLLQECRNLNFQGMLRLKFDKDAIDGRGQQQLVCNNWNTLAQYLQRPLHEVAATFHLGAHSVMTARFIEIFNIFMKQSKSIILPIKDSSFQDMLHYNQLEDSIRDTFRLMWSVPVIHSVLSKSSNIFHFHSKYLLQSDIVEEEDDESMRSRNDETDSISTQRMDPEKEMEPTMKTSKLVYKLFESNTQSYMTALTDYDAEVGHHTLVWKIDSVTVLVLDTVSGRLISKKKKTNRKKLEEIGREISYSQSKWKLSQSQLTNFSEGFLDEMQWNLLKNILNDDKITQLVLCSQDPFIQLDEIPDEYVQPTRGPNSYLPWQPTKADLIYFFETLFRWIEPKVNGVARTISLVASADAAYTTQIQDLWSGMFIQQVCVGKFNTNSNGFTRTQTLKTSSMDELGSKNSLNNTDTVVLSGIFGRMRYTHRLHGIMEWVIDSTADFTARADLPLDLVNAADILLKESASAKIVPTSAGFGVLKMLFSTPKAGGTWSMISPPEIPLSPMNVKLINITVKHRIDAVMTMGPVLGALYSYDMVPSSGQAEIDSLVMLPILIETNVVTKLILTAHCTLTSLTEHFEVDTAEGFPTLLRVGPLQIGRRYKLSIVSGIINKDDFALSISTCVHKSETNLAILNHFIHESKPVTSEFIRNVIERSRIPFSGLNVVLHMNIQTNLHQLIDIFRRMDGVLEKLKYSYEVKRVDWELRQLLSNLLERLRDSCRAIYTRPSSRELFRCAYNLFMLQLDHQSRRYKGDEGVAEILFGLITSRILQEYIYQFSRCRNNNYFYAMTRERIDIAVIAASSSKTDLSEGTLVRDDTNRKMRSIIASSKIKRFSVAAPAQLKKSASIREDISQSASIDRSSSDSRQVYSDSTMCPLDAVLQQWFAGLLPATMTWEPWRSANGLVVIEQCCAATSLQLDEVSNLIESEVIDRGTRLVVLEGQSQDGGADELFDDNSVVGLRFQKSVSKWLNERYQRAIMFTCPSSRDGTGIRTIRRLPDGSNTPVMMISPSFHSSSQLNSLFSKQERVIDDGYGILETMSDYFTMFESGEVRRDFFTITESKFVRGIPEDADPDFEQELYKDVGGERPAPADHLQLPDWLLALSPATPGMLVRDEVIMSMRSRDDLCAVFERLESNDLFADVVSAYNRSVFSQWSQDISSRELDFSSSDSVRCCLQVLMKTIWNEALTPDLRSSMMSLEDEWLTSYIVSFLRPRGLKFPSAVEFAIFITQVYIFSVALFMACNKQKELSELIEKYLDELQKSSKGKQTDDESDLDPDLTDEQLAEGAAPDNSAATGSASKEGSISRKYASSTLDRYYAAKTSLKERNQERIIQRRFYAGKFSLKSF